jgi:hypothetical protein
LIWLFAAACLTLLRGSAPAEAPRAVELRAAAASIKPVPARDAGQALLREVHSLRIAAPAPEPLPPWIPPHVAWRVERPSRHWLDDVQRGKRGLTTRVARWLRHVPRMDAGEPPRSDTFAS